jgi:hypothetical protein
MGQIARKPLPEKPLSEDFKKDTEDIERVSTEIQEPPPVHAKNFKVFGWELSAHRPTPPPYSDTTVYASAKPTMAQRFDKVLPPHRKYLGMRRKLFLIVLSVILVVLLALIIGLSVGLSSGSSK